ncbi:MAG: exopolyphosphatase [Solirubrobacteraceae bacterium]
MAATATGRCRLVTRSDFDGLVCAALLKELGILEEIKFVHPKDMQDGLIEITDRDITTNLPYVPTARLAFDHHESEMLRVGGQVENHVIDPNARSAARVVYDHFGGAGQFRRVSEELMEAVDKADSALFSLDEILAPQGWILMSFLMDPRTGLGRFHDFRISNYELMMELIDACVEKTVDEVLELPDVAERIALYEQHAAPARAQLCSCAEVHGKMVVLDLREEQVIHPTNRFMIYALYPQCNVSLHILAGLKGQNTVFAMGKSIIDRTSCTDVGELMLAHGGGGHEAAGTCQVAHEDAPRVLAELIERVNADG